MNHVDDSCPEGPGTVDRHEKWVRVEPGAVIPAGQPYRYEFQHTPHASEQTASVDRTVPANGLDYFLDSSWKPPLVLPTEPTWGIAVFAGPHTNAGLWRADESGKLRKKAVTNDVWQGYVEPVDFIPLTDEQVARIEAAR